MQQYCGGQSAYIHPDAFHTYIDGAQTSVFVLKNKNGLAAGFCNYGARWISFVVPDRNGQYEDIVLGFDSIQQYMDAEESYHGAVIGRVAGRIRQGSFELNDEWYKLSINEKLTADVYNHLHGGKNSFSFRVWDGKKAINKEGEESVQFTYCSPDGEEGYPGTLLVAVTYTLTNDNAVKIEYRAHTDTLTPVSLSNHAYFNLNGSGVSSILDHSLQISAKTFLEFDPQNLCVTGKILPVENTPMDFMHLKKIGADINNNHYQLIDSSGYNIYYVLEKNKHMADAVLQSSLSGRRLEIFTTEPGLQLYCAGYWSGKDRGKNNSLYQKYSGVALETHGYPDALHHPEFPGILLQPTQEYRQVTIYRFSNFETS
jgi:aldose 1-epimerase